MPPPKSSSQSLPSFLPRVFRLYKGRTQALPLHLEPSQHPQLRSSVSNPRPLPRAKLRRFRHSIVTVSLCRASRWLYEVTEPIFSLFSIHFRLLNITKPLKFKVVCHPKLHAVFDLTPPPFSSLVSSHRASHSFGTGRMSNGG
jgi:hypothetical protein